MLLSIPSRRAALSLIARTAVEGDTVHVPDCLADPEYTFLDYQAIGRYRSMLGVPLLRRGVVIGVIGLVRTTVTRGSFLLITSGKASSFNLVLPLLRRWS